jgi:subtilisin-like proprotein convertase family protein
MKTRSLFSKVINMLLNSNRINKIALLKKVGLFLLILPFCTISTQAQTKKCLTDIIHQQKMDADPQYRRQREQLEQKIQRFVENNKSREAGMVTIPVVFQVIHNGDPVGMNENLSDAQLNAQLAQLNADFGRTNTDAGNTPAAFQGVAANTMIQFCLATVDPNTNPTTGIVRTDINTLNNVSENDCWTADYISNNFVIPLAWNTANYLNIFTVVMIRGLDQNNNCIDEGTIGYATFPGGNPSDDVAVHLSRTIGSLSSPNPLGGTVGLGRTVTHEVGHWLMLDHIWGNGCGVDDGVADTPDQAQDNMGCPNHPSPSCMNGGDMFMNYMDYVNDNCMNLFTQGQATRMMAAINTSRPGLLNSQCGMNPGNDGFTCANAIEINAAGTYNAPGPSQGNGAIAGGPGTHANWYRFTPPMSGMIRIFTCGLANGGNNHTHVYHLNTQTCANLNLNDVVYEQDRGCAGIPMDETAGVLLENVPVTMGVPIFIEWDDAHGNTNPFNWTLEYMTAGNVCTDYPATNLNLNIPDNAPAGVQSMINVPTGGTIADVNIKNLNGTHTWIGDLDFTLQSPMGTVVNLIADRCNDNDDDDFNINLDDQAANPLSCPYNLGNTEQPENPLSVLNGQNPSGNWTLTVIDDAEGDTGMLQGWTLEICVSGGGGNCPPTRAVDDNPIAGGTFQAGTQLTSMGTIGAGNNVLFRAGNNVELKPNFDMGPNAILEIRIEGCQ